MIHPCFQCSKLQERINLIIDENKKIREELNKHIPFINILQKYNIYDINIFEEEIKNIIIYNKNKKINYDFDEKKNNTYNINNDKNFNISIQNEHIGINEESSEINNDINLKEEITTNFDNLGNISENTNEFSNNDQNNKKGLNGHKIDDIVDNINNSVENASFDVKKSKVSDIIIKRIIDFYNNYEDKYKLSFGDNKKVNNIVNNINLIYGTLNKRKSKIIYNYYNLYNEYLKEKNKNQKLKFNEYICYKADDVRRYNEKVKRSYILFSDLLNVVKDIENYGKKGRGKEITIVNILGKCTLSIDKLYKLRNNNYNKLIEFLKPIIINECKNDYEKSIT